jgi:hypothetical protein
MQPPIFRLAEKHERLHRLPKLPHTVGIAGGCGLRSLSRVVVGLS